MYNNFFEKKRCTIDRLISLILKKGNVPPFMYDFLTILLGDFLNIKIALICAVGVFTNVANVLQQDVNDDDFIIVICQSGTIFTLAGEKSNKIRLGDSPLCSFFAKQMLPKVNDASVDQPKSVDQPHSSIQEASTELYQDGGGSVSESHEEQLPVNRSNLVLLPSPQSVDQPHSSIQEASTESS